MVFSRNVPKFDNLYSKQKLMNSRRKFNHFCTVKVRYFSGKKCYCSKGHGRRLFVTFVYIQVKKNYKLITAFVSKLKFVLLFIKDIIILKICTIIVTIYILVYIFNLNVY